ncbi:MAG: hypothetical protein ACXAC8_09550 [Candidatus Hodarchaeales archaeon]|jgi:hypothetical protein
MVDDSNILSEETIFTLKQQEAWEDDQLEPQIANQVLSGEEDIVLVVREKFALYNDIKITDSTAIWTTKRIILYGIKIRSTLVADMVAREYEQRRGYEHRQEKLEPLKDLGWAIPYDQVTRMEIIQLGEKFSFYFFNNEERLFVVNDLDLSETDKIKEFMKKKGNINIVTDEFQIPLTDICLFIIGGFFLMIIGWIAIVIIF